MKPLENIQHYKIVLASNSPRRRELLSGLNLEYTVRVLPDIDESYPDTLKGEDIPMYISREKAEAYRNSMAYKSSSRCSGYTGKMAGQHC